MFSPKRPANSLVTVTSAYGGGGVYCFDLVPGLYYADVVPWVIFLIWPARHVVMVMISTWGHIVLTWLLTAYCFD